jgi:hypothetical protein
MICLPGLISVYFEPSRRTKDARKAFYDSVERDIQNNLNWLAVQLEPGLDIETLATGPYGKHERMVVGRGDRQILFRRGMKTHPGNIAGVRVWNGDTHNDILFDHAKYVNTNDTLECDITLNMKRCTLGALRITLDVE